MPKLFQKVGEYAVLVAVTLVACLIMFWVSSRDTSTASRLREAMVASPPQIAEQKPVVRVAVAEPKICDLSVTYSGKIRPWEDYSLGFEIGGRVAELGVNDRGEPLDEGDRVRAGQVLGRLDDRLLRARRAETVAQYEQAASDMQRAESLRGRGSSAITDAEFQEYATAMALARAQQDAATKNLEDAVLTSPVDGVIARRMTEAGESVGANTTLFEIVQDQDVLLVVDVPEARVRELEMRLRKVQQIRSGSGISPNPNQDATPIAADTEASVFRARVHLEGRDIFGRPWPEIEAEVYRIAQISDPRTGLFEIEIRIPNEDRLLRPGMVAAAEIVTQRVRGYELPEAAVLFRGPKAYVFTIRSEEAPLEVMFWKVADSEVHRADRIDLQNNWIDQGDKIIVPADAFELGPIVTRGQHRLASGQLVRVVNRDALGATSNAQERVVEEPPIAPPTGLPPGDPTENAGTAEAGATASRRPVPARGENLN